MQDLISLYDFVGLVGVGLSVGCYARLQWRRDFAKTYLYSGLNALASILILISLTQNWNLASATINLAWLVISLYGLYRCRKYTLRQHQTP